MCRGLYYETLELQIDMPNSRIVFNILNADARLILCQKRTEEQNDWERLTKWEEKSEKERMSIFVVVVASSSIKL